MRKNNSFIYIFLLFLFPSYIFSQNIRTNHEINILNEQSVSSDSSFHFTIKPYSQKDFSKFKAESNISVSSKLLDNLLNKDLFNVEKDNVSVRVNPLIHSQTTYENIVSSLFFNYKTGLSINSKFKDKLFFTSDIFYSKVQFPVFQKNFVDSFGIIPHYGHFISNNENNYTFFSFNGELSYNPTKNISLYIGNGKHFLGNGYRSLFLSDNSNSYPYFKTTVDIWRIKYFWMIAKLSDFELYNSEQNFNLYNKAAFIHYFSLNITKRINFNFFEAIISNPYDINRNKTGYEAAYFNPVIFYRPIEFYAGTSDNSLMGIGLNLRLFNSLHLYSQFILDDLIISRLNDGSGWWGNKFGIQTGMKAYNFLNVTGLFFRGEINLIRPYTYSHGVAVSENALANLNYGNYHQNLAHPAGANFIEAISVIRYNIGRFSANAKIILAKKGSDTDTISYGSNIYKDYNLRPSDLGITFLQGEITNLTFIDFHVSYLINPNYNLRLELGIFHRKEANDFTENKNTVFYFGFSSKLFNEHADY
ncbi:MAG: hypothetical protein L3J35_01000 [Bacteroidales bacterium]|nr:hypothetical protein [Bacteroidales bacterium]